MKNRTIVFKLHDLIKSLKKEEKRFFKIQAKKYSQNDHAFYLKVFDYLNKVDVVDQEVFKKKFKQVKGLSSVQTYLYDQILKSLRAQQTNKNVDILLSEGLIDLQILFNKDLYADAQQVLMELLPIAQLHDKIFFLLQLYEWWFRLENVYFRYRDVDDVILNEYVEKYKKSVNSLEQYHAFRMQLSRLTFKVKNQNPRQVIDFVEEMERSIQDYQPDEKNLSTGIAELQLRYFLSSVTRDSKAAYFYCMEVHKLLKKQPKEVFDSLGIVYYSTLLTALHKAPSLEEAMVVLEEVNSTDWSNVMVAFQYSNSGYITAKINIYLLTGKLNEGKQFVEKCMTEQKKVFNFSSGFLYYKYALFYYAYGDYDIAMEIIDKHLEGKKSNPMNRNFSAILRIVMYYEQEEYTLLAYFLTNLRRRLRDSNVKLKIEGQFLSFMGKQVNLIYDQRIPAMVTFRNNLVAELAELPNYEKEIFTTFNLIGWMDSRIHKQPFTQYFFWKVEDIAF